MKLIIINLLIAIVGTGIAAYWDHKTGIVPDRLSHIMIIAGVLLAPFAYWNRIVFTYALGIAVFGLGFLLYSFGQLGGGDVKLFTALSLLIPFYPQELAKVVQTVGINPVEPVYPFIGSIFVLAGIIGPMLIMSLNFHRRIIRHKEEIESYRKKSKKGIILSLLILPMMVIWTTLSYGFLLLFIPMALTMYLMPFKNDMIKIFFSEEKKISELNEDDVLALEEIDEDKKEDLNLWRKTFTPPELRKIKKKAQEKNYENIKVCENLPRFVPYIFFSLIANLIFGDVLLYLIRLSIS